MKKTHRILSILTAFVVFLSGAFQAPLFSNAETKTEHVTFYYLLVGVQFVNEKQFNKPYPNIKETVVLPNFGDFKKMKNIRLIETKAYDFNDNTPWENDEYLIRSTEEWTPQRFRDIYEHLTSSQIYNISGTLSGRTFTKTFDAQMQYKNGGQGIECFSILRSDLVNGKQKLHDRLFNHNGILGPLGEEGQFRSNYKDCAEYLDYAINNYNKPNHDKDKLYVVFTPTIGKFEADLEVEIKQGTLNAKLNAPSQVKIGKDFEVSDATILSSDLKYVEGKLERQVGSSAFTTVATWPGPGTKGANSGRSFQDSFDSACSVTYRLTVKADNNQTSSYETTVNVSSSAGSDYSIDLNWNIDSPVYEGHNCFARDYTDFIEKTTEEDEEGNEYPVTNYYSVGDRHGGRHYFTTNATDYSERKASNITQQFNFWQKGNYKVTVEENFHGLEAYDTKYVEVLKTPTILDTLSGTQKANRKQILSADIALNPRYPLADWEIVITDNGTGEKATLSPSRLSVSTTNIKTKEVKVTTDVDGCYSHLSVEFLTKTPGTKRGNLADAYSDLSGKGLIGAGANSNGTEPFSYEIFVKDTRGYTDRIDKDFDVKPDYKPIGEISMDNAFIREAGQNYAYITMEDLSRSNDGDSVLRKWYIQEWNKSTEKNTYLTSEMSAAGFTEEDCKEHWLAPTEITEYDDLSYGSKQKIKIKREGVGKFRVLLVLRDKWNEETIPEFISGNMTGDTLSSWVGSSLSVYPSVTNTSANAPFFDEVYESIVSGIGDVINVAPIVSLEPIDYIKTRLTFITRNDSDFREVENMKTNLRADLLADAINTDIANLKVTLPSSDEWPEGDRGDTEREIFNISTDKIPLFKVNNYYAASPRGYTSFDDNNFYTLDIANRRVKAYNLKTGDIAWDTIIPHGSNSANMRYMAYSLDGGSTWIHSAQNDSDTAVIYSDPWIFDITGSDHNYSGTLRMFTDNGEHLYIKSASGEIAVLNAVNGAYMTTVSDGTFNASNTSFTSYGVASAPQPSQTLTRNTFSYGGEVYTFREDGLYKLGSNSKLIKLHDSKILLNEGGTLEATDLTLDPNSRDKCFKFIDGKLTFLETVDIGGDTDLYYVQYDLGNGDIKRRKLCSLSQCANWAKDFSNVEFFSNCLALSNDGAVLVSVGRTSAYNVNAEFTGSPCYTYPQNVTYSFAFDNKGNMTHVFFNNTTYQMTGRLLKDRALGHVMSSARVVPIWDSKGNFESFAVSESISSLLTNYYASQYNLAYIEDYYSRYGTQRFTMQNNIITIQREFIVDIDGTEHGYFYNMGATPVKLTFAYLSPDKTKVYANYEGVGTLTYNVSGGTFSKAAYSYSGCYLTENLIVQKNGNNWTVYQKNKSLDDLYSIALTKNLNNDSDSKVRDTVVLYDKNATINASMVSSGEKAFESDPFILALGSPGASYVQSITSNVDAKGTPSMTFNSLSEIKAKIVSLFKDNSDANNFVKIDSASGGYIEKTYHNLEDGKEYYYEVEYGAGEKPGATQIFSKVNSHGAEPGDLIGGTYEVVKSIKEEFDNPTKVNSTFTIQSVMTISQGKLNFATGGYNILYIDVPAGYTGKLSFKANANVVRNETNGNSNSGTYPFADIYGEAYLSIKDRYGNLLDEWVDAAAIRTLNNESRHQVIEMLPEGRNYIEYRAYNLTANTIQFDYLQLDLVKANTPTTLGNQVIQNLKTSGSKGANVDKGTFAATHTIPNYILKEQRSGSYKVGTVPSVPLIQNIDGADYVLERVERGSFGNLFDVTYHVPYSNAVATYGNTYTGKTYPVNVPQGYMGKLAFSYMGSATNYGRGCGSQTANYTISLVDPSKPARSNVVSSWSNSLPIAVQNTANSSYKLSSNTKYFSSSGYLVAGRYSLTSSIKLSFYNNGFKEVSGYGMTGKLDSDMYVLYLYRPADANDYAARNQVLYKEIVEYKEFEGLLSTQYWNYYSSKTSTSVDGSPAISTGKYAGQRLNQYVLVYNSRTSGMDRYDMSFPAYNFFTQEEYRLNLSAGIKVVSAKGKLNISEHSLSSGTHTAVSGFGYYGTGDRNTLPWYGVSGEGRDRLQINGRDSFVDFGDKTYPYRAQAAWSNPLATPWDNGTYPLLSHNCPTSAVWYKHIRDDKDVNLSNVRFTYTYSANAYLNSGNYYVGDVDKNGTDNVLIPLASTDGNTTVRIPVNAGTTYIKNFKIYYLEKGKKIYIDDNMTLAKNYKTWTGNNASISVVNYQSENDEPEDPALIYKKGEYVAQKVNYSDYEADPLKKGYWIYVHQAFNDGPHAKAGIVLNDDEEVISIGGTSVAPGAYTIEQAAQQLRSSGNSSYILTEPINRFYEDGKYYALYYAYDDTSRGKTSGGNPVYDKASNIAEIVFYIIGESSTAPYIKSIKTNPLTVVEDENAKIRTEYGDMEGDTLSLTVELYRDSERILRQRWTGLTPDSSGNYPEKITNSFTCEEGAYTVIATVRDATGVGSGTYTFKVGSGAKIEGLVSHTEKWEANRKAYNMAKFGEEGNFIAELTAYAAGTNPRKRGTNVFWAGEAFCLTANVKGKAQSVTCTMYVDAKPAAGKIRKREAAEYTAVLHSTGSKTSRGEVIYEGRLEDKAFRLLGQTAPEEVRFVFTAAYSGGKKKECEARVIVDNTRPYELMHRIY